MEAIDWSVKITSGFMKQLESRGLTQIVTSAERSLKELHPRISDDVDNVILVRLRGRQSIYVPYKTGDMDGYKFIGIVQEQPVRQAETEQPVPSYQEVYDLQPV